MNGTPKGSGTFRGEAGVLFTAMNMLKEWAENQQVQSLDQAKGSMVLFTLGQSNSANHGQGLYQPAKTVYNYYDGKLYRAADPLDPTGRQADRSRNDGKGDNRPDWCGRCPHRGVGERWRIARAADPHR